MCLDSNYSGNRDNGHAKESFVSGGVKHFHNSHHVNEKDSSNNISIRPLLEK